METLVHKTLGRERIRQICVKHGLGEDEQKIVDELLEKWEGLVGQLDKKAQVALELVGENPHHMQIISAVMKITAEFALKRLQKK